MCVCSGVNEQVYTNPGEAAPQLKVHDVVLVELLQAFVEVVLQDGGVGDETCSRDEGLLKLLPHHVLVWIFSIWILSEQSEVLH